MSRALAWTALGVATCLGPGASAASALATVTLPGTSEHEGWAEMTTAHFPGYGMFPGADPWPAPIDPTEPGSAGNADFDKLSGNGYPGGEAVYAPFTSSVFAIETHTAPGFDIRTLVFQADIGPGDEGNFLDAGPTLSYDGGSQALAPDFVASAPGDHPYTNPTDPSDTGTTTAWAYQWDLTGLGSITSYTVEWTTHAHVQLYELQVDVGDTFAQAVPEPGGVALAATGLVVLTALGRRRVRR